MRTPTTVLATLLAAAAPLAAPADDAGVRVYAAASLTEALIDVADTWAAAGHPRATFVYAASSTLAKQIVAGAPAAIYASADLKWMDYLEARGRIVPGSRVNVLGNTLVLIAPAGRRPRVELTRAFDIAAAFTGKLCTGETTSVPAGVYARQSLTALGWWSRLEGRVVGTDDVRTALAFVERGECALGIVYATDAAISDDVEVVARLPDDTHDPIVYPFALVTGAGPAARAFFAYLTRAPAARAAFARRAFVLLPH